MHRSKEYYFFLFNQIKTKPLVVNYFHIFAYILFLYFLSLILSPTRNEDSYIKRAVIIGFVYSTNARTTQFEKVNEFEFRLNVNKHFFTNAGRRVE